MTRYQKLLVVVFLLVWVWAAIAPKFPHDWLLENLLVFLFVPVIALLGRYFRLSEVSYTLITVFMCLHLVGSHYTFAEVPFGYTLQEWLGASRNMYDRLVHFSFGFLLAYPIREIFVRIARVRGFWSYYLPLDVALSFSALYEIIEWAMAQAVDPSAGAAYLGTQGDEWDAQKDMAMAGIGALLAMIVIAVIVARYDKNFWVEFRSSFRLLRDDKPLGEVRLKELRTASGADTPPNPSVNGGE
jgi:putative membrane protein